MVGVGLGSQPDDHIRSTVWSIESDEGIKYYIAEATWNDPFTKSWDYDIIGTAVGDSPWSSFEGVIVKT